MNCDCLRRTRLAVVVFAAAQILSACVESQVPLITNAQPLLGQEFEVHLYEKFVDNKATGFHTSVYRWKDGKYMRASGLARDVKTFVAQKLEANDFLIQATNEREKIFEYWLGRKLSDGVYLIFPLDETDVDDATRGQLCRKGQEEGMCLVDTYEQLAKLARATAAKPVRDAALAVTLAR